MVIYKLPVHDPLYKTQEKYIDPHIAEIDSDGFVNLNGYCYSIKDLRKIVEISKIQKSE